jgi:hypothetical protein
MSYIPEEFAAGLFRHCINEGRCAEAMDCFHEGGTITFDPIERKILMIPGSIIAQSCEESQ